MSQLVMVIDDSPTIRAILDICLRRAGYAVTCFQDGVEALRWLDTPGAIPPALVMVDLGLPKLDGFEVIQQLKARPDFEHTMFVILSRRDGMLDRIKGRLVGAQAYVTKPFRTQTILTLVQECLSAARVGETIEHLPPNQPPVPAHAQAGSRQPAQQGGARP